MPQPPVVTAVADPLVEAYRTAWYTVLEEQDRVLEDPRQWRRSRRLSEMSRSIGSIMDDLDSQAADWVANQFPKAYGAGLVDGANAAGTEAVWSMIHQEAVEQLAYGIYEDLLSATTHVKSTTKDLIRMLARQAGTTALIAGETAQAAGRTLASQLAANSIAAVIYKNGARVGLAQYAEMNLRTTTALGYNNGTLNASPKTVYWEVFDGPGCGWTFHEDTEQALGKIVTRDEALSYPISHPNCRRAFGPRPDLNKTASAKENLDSVKYSQIVAQRAQDTERLAKQARAASRRRAGGRPPRASRTSRAPKKSLLTDVDRSNVTVGIQRGWSDERILKMYPASVIESPRGRALLEEVKAQRARGVAPAPKPERTPYFPKNQELPRKELPKRVKTDTLDGHEMDAELFKGIEELNARYPKAISKLDEIRYGGRPGHTMLENHNAHYSMDRYWKPDVGDYRNRPYIGINPKYADDVAAANRQGKLSSSSGWHPPRSGGILGTVHHEFGHHMDMMLPEAKRNKLRKELATYLEGRRAQRRLSKPQKIGRVSAREDWMSPYSHIVTQEVSGYAATNDLELIAEAFAEYMAFGDEARPIAQIVGHFFDDQWMSPKSVVL